MKSEERDEWRTRWTINQKDWFGLSLKLKLISNVFR